jgi:hypothetical protein
MATTPENWRTLSRFSQPAFRFAAIVTLIVTVSVVGVFSGLDPSAVSAVAFTCLGVAVFLSYETT